jgi:hypothetical protein
MMGMECEMTFYSGIGKNGIVSRMEVEMYRYVVVPVQRIDKDLSADLPMTAADAPTIRNLVSGILNAVG